MSVDCRGRDGSRDDVVVGEVVLVFLNEDLQLSLGFDRFWNGPSVHECIRILILEPNVTNFLRP